MLLLDKLNPKHWQDETRWLEGITDSIDMSLSKLQSWWWIGKPGMLQCMGVKRVRHDWTTKLKLKLRNQRSYCQNPLDHRKSKRVSEKRLLYWLCQSLWLCGSQQAMENSKEMRIPGYLTCLLRNLYTGQEATVGTLHGTTNWFKNWERKTSKLYIVILLT